LQDYPEEQDSDVVEAVSVPSQPVKILLGNNYSRIYGDLSPYIHGALSERMSFVKQGFEHTSSYKNETWDGMVRLYLPGVPFMTGLVSLVKNVLTENKVGFQFIDRRNRVMGNFPELKFSPPSYYEKREYGDFTINRSIDWTRGIINMGTGGGKTFIAAELIARLQVKPFIFYTLTKDLLYQAKDCFSSCFNCEIGQVGDGKVDPREITVCTKDAVVYAINKGKKLNLGQYRFDTADVWDEKSVFGETDTERIVDMVKQARGVFFDECVSGESIVVTENGCEKASVAEANKSRYMKTYDGIRTVMMPVLNWWKKGRKKVVEVIVSNGRSIRCTQDHLMFTKRGWICAGNLKNYDHVLCANVGVDDYCRMTSTEGKEDLYLGIKSEDLTLKNGKENTKSMLSCRQNAIVDVEERFLLVLRMFQSSFLEEAQKNTRNSYQDMTRTRFGRNITLIQLMKKCKLLLERVLGTHLCLSQIIDQQIVDWSLIMGRARPNGQCTNQVFWKDLELRLRKALTLDTEIDGYRFGQDVYNHLPRSSSDCMMEVRKSLKSLYSMKLEVSRLHGGSAMMAADPEKSLCFIPRGFLRKKTRLYLHGLPTQVTKTQYASTKDATSRFWYSQQNRRQICQKESEHTSPNACNTSWSRVMSVVDSGEDEVYDFEIDGTHSFFANGLLVHNCHHASATTCKDTLLTSENAYWRFGATATLMREDGEEMMIQGLFGKKIVDISLSYLIRNKWLVPATVFFVPVSFDSMLYRSYSQIYKNCITENQEISAGIANMTNYLVSLGKRNLILVTHKKHGKSLKALIPGSVFLTGDESSDKRKKTIESMRSGNLMVIIATSLADEGLDIPNLDVVHMAGAGASITRVPQRVGRVVRRYPLKRYGLAFYYHYCTEYLYQQGFKAKKILAAESEIEIIQTADMKDAWKELVRFMNRKETLFG
jgi:superfamily II DNA or RNA helicase